MNQFYKYQGAGNDFILFDNRDQQISLTENQVAHWCHRNFGIGADGLILLQSHESLDFEMVYYNSDGRESTLCGNGGRCITQFAYDLGIISGKTEFLAIDGTHQAEILKSGLVSLHMNPVKQIQTISENDFVLDTGSPHYVQFRSDIETLNVDELGRSIRNQVEFVQEGINVNFVSPKANNQFRIRTYERGVEGETLACGTGITAAALASIYRLNHLDKSGEPRIGTHQIDLTAQSGDQLQVKADWTADGFERIELIGPATYVFKGSVELK